jgi:hypothetical protein
MIAALLVWVKLGLTALLIGYRHRASANSVSEFT